MSRNQEKNWKNKAFVEIEEDFFFGVKEGREIPVAEVVPGMELISTWTRTGQIAKTVKVTKREPCSGGNGMQVHLNKSNCYDSRCTVWVR